MMKEQCTTMPYAARQRSWRVMLLAWAEAVRGCPYVWGKTDCAALVRDALWTQFGRDVLPTLSPWTSVASALHALKEIEDTYGGVGAFFVAMGACEITGRQHARWPMGTVLVTYEDNERIPAFGVCIDAAVVQSDEEHGVQWCTFDSVMERLQGAWLFERVPLVEGGDDG